MANSTPTELSLAPDNNVVNKASISWSHDGQYITTTTGSGFEIYSLADLHTPTRRRKIENGSFRIAESLPQYNLVALVGDDDNQQFPPNRLRLWDDNHRHWAGSFNLVHAVRGVRLTKDRIVVVLERQVQVFSMATHRCLRSVATAANPNGLCAVSHDRLSFVMALPGLNVGEVRLDCWETKAVKFVNAHQSQLSQLALSNDGRILATASVTGTVIRVYDAMKGYCLQEVRRGASKAQIYSLGFSLDNKWLVASSDRATIHVFGLKLDHEQNQNSSKTVSFLRGALPKYCNSEWSFAKFYVPQGVKFFPAFGHDNVLSIIGEDGSFYRCSFDQEKGGEMDQLDYLNIFNDNHNTRNHVPTH